MTTTQWDDEASPQPGITITTASTIRPEPIAWIWPGWLAAGKLHVLAGMAGTGKTTIALAVAATLTGRGEMAGWRGVPICCRCGYVEWRG